MAGTRRGQGRVSGVDLIIVALQLALAGILAVAAVGKFLDLPGSRKAVHDFGVPTSLADLVGTALPAIEMLLAILLLPGATARWAALGAAILFLAFIAGIGFNLAKGSQPDCHCFGQFHSAPAGWPTIIRNSVFTLMAAIIVWLGAVGPVEWFSGFDELSQIAVLFGAAITALLGLQTWLLLRGQRQVAALLERLGGGTGGSLPILGDEATADGTFAPRSAPVFDLPLLAGGTTSLASLTGRGKPTLLLFVDPGCGPCRSLVPDMQEWHRRFADDFSMLLISRGDAENNREKFGDLPVALQENREVFDRYEAKGTPTGILVSTTGMIWDEYAPGRDRIRELVVRTTRGETGKRREVAPKRTANGNGEIDPRELLRIPEGPEVGTSGTRLPLPALDGGYLGLDDLRGERRVLLFFSPDCVFCQRMLPDLREWEEEAGDGVARLVIVSGGAEEANRAMGLRSRVVLDDGFTTGNDYGVTGTPSAIVIDEEGRVASPIATGADAVLDLLDAELLPVDA